MRKILFSKRLSLLLFGVVCIALSGGNTFAGPAQIVIVNNNAAGVGFNDPTPAAPVGGNTGTTLGQQRLIAFQFAANIWGARLDSSVPIRIRAQFTPLAAGVLGSAGPISVARDFPNAPLPGTWYHVALANKLAGVDLFPANDDINATFSTNFNFYLGIDNNHGPLNDLVAVLLHEFAHGLGFSQNASLTSGALLNGFPDAYNTKLLDLTTGLHWNQMTNAQRVASATNFGRVVWDGSFVTAGVPSVLVVGSPDVKVISPPVIAGSYQFGTAAFGPAIGNPNVSADVVAAEDAVEVGGTSTDGCSPFANAAAVAGKIALIERGLCGFAVKARNATDAGAVGVIIYNELANVNAAPPNMADDGINGVFVTIPTVDLRRADGLAILGQLGGGVTANIEKDTSVRAGADPLGRARVYAPFPVVGGSSISHFDTVASRNLLMEPAINGDLTHNVMAPDDLTFELLRDVGWTFTQPTAAKLGSFTATAHDGNVLLNWKTGFEVDNLGFNVYREVDGVRTRITPQVVAGSALSDGPGTSLLSGHNYYWADSPPAGKGVRYWLEDIDLNGTATFNGPYSITNASAGSAAEAQKQSELISQIGLRQALLAGGLGSARLTPAATLSQPSAAAMQTQSGLASQPAVKISVKHEGYYRVTQAELLRATLDPKVDPRLLQLFVDGIEQPIKVTGEQDGRFDSGDAVEFYGVGLDSASTDTRVYWLVAGATPGKRIAITQSKGEPISSVGFPFTVERKDRTIYFSGLRNGDAENFFGAVVASQPVDQSLSIQHLDQTAQAGASLEVSLQGVTKLGHNVRVQLNGTDVTKLSFNGQSQGRRLVSISQSTLREGENTVRLIAEGGPSDVSLVDVIRINYSHSYVAEGDALNLTAQANRQVSISGFTRRDLRLMDVTDAGSAQEIVATVTEGKNGNTVTGAPSGSGTRAVLAFSDSQAKHPWSIAANQPSSLRQPVNGADMLIITQRDYYSTIASLKALRESQGLSVAVVDIEDIYDEFSFGNSSPQAVKDFATYATTNWKKKPRYLLLAGDASYDPKNNLGLGLSDLVPTKLLDTVYLETASDDWFADFNNDGVPELAVGRLPFRNAGEASTMIAKIVGYEQSRPSEEVLLVADSNDGFDFEAASGQLAGTLPTSLKINQINRGGDTAAARTRLIEAINRGQKLVNYAGHGSSNQWRGNLLANEDAAQMKNTDHLSVFVMMTCLTGYFGDPGLDSLAESLLKAERGGAVAVWSSSGMTLPVNQSRMNQELYKSMFGPEGIALLGDAIREAKAKNSDIDIRRTWVLLGDPSMRLR